MARGVRVCRWWHGVPALGAGGRGLLLLAVLALAGCSGKASKPGTGAAPSLPPASATAQAGAPATAALATPASVAATPAATATATASATVTARAGTSSPAASRSGTPAAADQAVMAVIQKANTEQQQALAQRDPTRMQDTATPSYYAELVRTLRDLLNGGVVAIKLTDLQWGPVAVQGTTAQATTVETWQSTLVDGSSTQSQDRNIYALVQQGGAWLISADVHPDTQLQQPGAGAPPAPRATIPPSGATAPGGATPASGAGGATQSRNWAGYVATGGTYTAVSGSWTVPQVTASGAGGGADATWVGIGGADSNDLVQAGTQATVVGPGQVQYSAWVETLPQPSRDVALAVSAGDVVSVSLAQQGSGSWQISIANQTTGQQFQTTVQYNSSLSSAEWIEEAPSAGSFGLRVVTLDDFGSVQIQNAMTVSGGKQLGIAQAGGQPTAMYGRGGQPLAQPSALGSDGASFTVTRIGSGSSPSAP